MTIDWQFINIPRGSQFCRVTLGLALPEQDYSFNLAAHTPGDITWVRAAAEFVSGNRAENLMIEAHRGQDVLLFIKNAAGEERRLRYHPKDFWIDEGDLVSFQELVNLDELFSSDNDTAD
jgi:hypothetical protein